MKSFRITKTEKNRAGSVVMDTKRTFSRSCRAYFSQSFTVLDAKPALANGVGTPELQGAPDGPDGKAHDTREGTSGSSDLRH